MGSFTTVATIISLAIGVGSFIYTAVQSNKMEREMDMGQDYDENDIEITQMNEGKPVPVIFGRQLVAGNIIGYNVDYIDNKDLEGNARVIQTIATGTILATRNEIQYTRMRVYNNEEWWTDIWGKNNHNDIKAQTFNAELTLKNNNICKCIDYWNLDYDENADAVGNKLSALKNNRVTHAQNVFNREYHKHFFSNGDTDNEIYFYENKNNGLILNYNDPEQPDAYLDFLKGELINRKYLTLELYSAAGVKYYLDSQSVEPESLNNYKYYLKGISWIYLGNVPPVQYHKRSWRFDMPYMPRLKYLIERDLRKDTNYLFEPGGASDYNKYTNIYDIPRDIEGFNDIRDYLASENGYLTHDDQYNLFIGHNPAVIIYDLLTNTLWGCSVDTDNINFDNFYEAAKWFWTEKIGINTVLAQGQKAKDFIFRIQQQTDCYLYKDTNDKYALKIIKEEDIYSPTAVIVDSDYIDMAISRKSWDDTYNSFTADYMASDFRNTKTLTLKNDTNIDNTGNERNKKIDMRMYSNLNIVSERLNKIMRRESYPYATAKMTTNLSQASLIVGDVIEFDSDEYNVDMFFRVISIDINKLEENKLGFDLMEVREAVT